MGIWEILGIGASAQKKNDSQQNFLGDKETLLRRDSAREIINIIRNNGVIRKEVQKLHPLSNYYNSELVRARELAKKYIPEELGRQIDEYDANKLRYENRRLGNQIRSEAGGSLEKRELLLQRMIREELGLNIK
jgi:hypothetical protein